MRVILGSISAVILCFPFVIAAAHAAEDEWYTYRHDSARTGAQPYASDLSDPAMAATLRVQWGFAPTSNGVAGFKASPIVVDDTVFIGNTNGFFYALDAATGTLKWQYPPDKGLIGSCGHPTDFAGGWGSYGIPSSATYAKINGQDAVIFGAPDPDPGTDGGAGSGRLFALDFSGNPIWKYDGVHAGSDVVAHVDCSPGSTLHERIAYSSPLVSGNKVYVGIHDTGDNPIQQGRVRAVDLNTGKLTSFQFLGAGKTPGDGSLGGGVWNALATDETDVYFTTGNTHFPWCNYPYVPPNCPVLTEPPNNNGLSMIRVDKDTGSIVWKYQPVPFRLDGDPDWAAGATVMSASCGELIASVQKDGWSYAIDAEQSGPAPACPLGGHSWQFPPTTKGCQFSDTCIATKTCQQHGDDDYRRPGAAWNDVFIVRTGGEANTDDSPCGCEDNLGTPPNCPHGIAACRGWYELHALNACATSEHDRVRWIANIPNNIGGNPHISYSTPTVTGGIVFIGTYQDPSDNKGHLVVLADPTIVPASQQVCSNPDYSPNSPLCTGNYAPVWSLQPLASIAMPDGGSLASMRNEPVLARGRVFVATNPNSAFPNAGHVYMLAATPEVVGVPDPDIAATLVPTETIIITIENN
jgi:hypothetical protein